MPRYYVMRVGTEKEISSLEVDWNRLSESAALPNVFMTLDWFRVWNQRFAQEDPHRRPNILVLKRDREVMGISPLIFRTCVRFGIVVRKIEFVGDESDHNDFVLGDDAPGQIEAIAHFLAQTSNEWDLVELRRLRGNESLFRRIESALSHANLLYRILPERESCPFFSIGADSSALMTNLSAHVRRTLRNRIVRANAEGLRARIIEKPHQEPGLVKQLIDLEGKKKNAWGPFIGKYPEVFQSLFDALGPRGWLYVALLEKGDNLVAFQLGFRCGSKLWDYSKAYDPFFSQFAPGTLLIYETMNYGSFRGYDEYDFLRGEEPYKMVWSTGCRRGGRLQIWNRSLVSRVRAFAYCDVRAFIYRLLNKQV